MPTEQERTIDLVVRLIELTQQNSLTWQSGEARASLNRDEDLIVESYFTAKYKEKIFAIYRVQFKIKTELPYAPSSLTAMYLSGLFGKKTPQWETRIFLELVDDRGKHLWTFPDVSGLHDLLEAVKYQVAGVKDLLDDILGSSN
ncbi:MAG: hypothetical protein Q8P51_13150 [Ignavibacteria bacterium]|nr:hypothetical protein [Ignavibacteria bacterium]